MPTDNDNEGPGLGLGDLNDIFNDDPFSNAGAESPTGDHHFIFVTTNHCGKLPSEPVAVARQKVDKKLCRC